MYVIGNAYNQYHDPVDTLWVQNNGILNRYHDGQLIKDDGKRPDGWDEKLNRSRFE